MINDYDSLQAAIADELARADLTAVIPTFIQLAEADLNRTLRTRQMQVVVSGTSTGQLITLPADLRAVQALYVSFGGVGQELYPLPPQRLAETLVTSGPPLGYVITGDTLTLIAGQGDLAYTLVYYQALPPVSTTQNWVIQREPGLYLYQSLAHTAPFLKDDARLQLWASLAKAIRDGMEVEDDDSRYGNAPSVQVGIRCAP